MLSSLKPLHLPNTNQRFGSNQADGPSSFCHYQRQSGMDSCAVVALRDMFHFYGNPQVAQSLEAPLRKLLSNIKTQGIHAVDRSAMERAFHSFPPSVDHGYDIAKVLQDVHHSGAFTGLVSHVPEKNRLALSTPLLLLFMAECGVEPRHLRLNHSADRQTTLRILNQHQPIIVAQNKTVPLISRLQGKSGEETGHMFVLYKPTAHSPVLLYDINSPEPLVVPENELLATFDHPEALAIVFEQTPPVVPARLLGEPTVDLPL